MTTDSDALDAVRAWLRETVVGLDLCPFARGPLAQGLVHVVGCRQVEPSAILADLLVEAQRLVDDGQGTSLLVLTGVQPAFGPFLDLCYAAEDALSAAGFDRSVQVVGFHPDYVFDGAPPDDPANAVNRSPVALLHLLRWAEVNDAINSHRDIAEVPRRNARLLRERAGWSGDET